MKERKHIRIGIFGVALSSVNYGVIALAYTQIQILQDIANEHDIEIEYWVFSDEDEATIDKVCRLLNVRNIYGKYVIRIRTGIRGLLRMKKDIEKCNFIIDLTYGDSFADIYGEKNYWLYSMPKILTLINKKDLILGPQTIGPFIKKYNRYAAAYIMNKVKYIIVRDILSYNEVVKLTGRKDILITSDLAMNLPYNKSKYSPCVKNKVNVGMNVSALLWRKNSANSRINVNLSYKDLTYRLINELLKRDYAIHLIVHEYEINDKYSEYKIATEIHEKFPETILAPQFSDPIDAKSYMSNLDLIIGARMHATIGAFSSGVPVIPIAYSRKFEGLYNSIGYNHSVDCSKNTVDDALKLILSKIDYIDKLKDDTNKALVEVQRRNKLYYDFLKNYILKYTFSN